MDERDATRLKLSTPPLGDSSYAAYVDRVFKQIPDYNPSDKLNFRDLVYFLVKIVSTSEGRLDPKYKETPAAQALLKGDSELAEKLRVAWRDRSLWEILDLRKLRAPISTHPKREYLLQSRRLYINEILDQAYRIPFVGDASKEFIKYILGKDASLQSDREHLYAKVIPVVQSSGTGKSRMLTEVGRNIFTLPICLRGANDLGYPVGDVNVHDYFRELTKDNDLGFTAHIKIACFLAAAHETMLKRLKGKWEEQPDGRALLGWWHEVMEQKEREYRDGFFSDVLSRAKGMQANFSGKYLASSHRRPDGVDESKTNIEKTVKEIYDGTAKPATSELLEFIRTLGSSIPILSITYVDEADGLDELLWVWQRLTSHQSESTAMWYVFMATKSSISYFHPEREKLHSMRLRDEMKDLLPPYNALGFDQIRIAETKSAHSVNAKVKMGDLRSLTHLCKYGRPLWHALYPHDQDGIIQTAKLKLTGGHIFNVGDRFHALSVLSQRLCIDLVLAASETFQLADRSVSHHMRLLTGISSKPRIFYTHSPSEPILALAATQALFETSGTWAAVLETFSQQLCESGVVEKGLIGELAARTFLLIARDLAAPLKENGKQPDMLQPISILSFFDTLFGDEEWSTPHRHDFEKSFRRAHLNFTHWIVTMDCLPEQPDLQLLANLWARQAALQCAFNQESIDLLIPMYAGSIKSDAFFDPAMLSAVIIQVKYKAKADTTAESEIRPLGVARDHHIPLPYIAFLMELGNESRHRQTNKKVKCTSWQPSPFSFNELVQDWAKAVNELETYKAQENPVRSRVDALMMVVTKKQAVMESYNRYSISARGVSDVYGVSQRQGIKTALTALLKVTMPSPAEHSNILQQMRPLGRLVNASGYTDSMAMYALDNTPELDPTRSLPMNILASSSHIPTMEGS